MMLAAINMKQDLQFALRSLGHARGFTIAATLTLALAMGANTVVYGIVSALMLRPLPFGDRSDRLVTLHSTHPTQATDWNNSELSYPDLLDLRDQSSSFAAIEGLLNRNLSLSASGDTERVRGASVTPGLFALLGVEPQLGRSFTDDDGAEPGAESVVIISHGLWQRLFAGDPAISGRTVPVNARKLTIIGVMPPRFAFPEHHDLWLPYRAPRDQGRDRRSMLAVGLLRPGVDLSSARSDVSSIASVLSARYPATNRAWGVHVMPLRDLFVDDGTRRALGSVLAAVGLVLLVGCANVASLLVARGIARRHELTVRTALGATRARVTRLLVIESLVLAIVGGALGLLIASWGLDALIASMPEPPPYWAQPTIDGRVLAFTFVLTLLTALACGLLPALRVSRLDVAAGLLHGARTSGASPDQRRLQGMLVVGQVALSLALLISATLLVRSTSALLQADAGFNPAPLLSFRLYLAGDAYNDPLARARALEQVVARLRALPGVAAAAATGAIPADDGGDGIRLVPVGGTGVPDEEIGGHLVPVTSALFDTLGLRLLEGRTFTEAESDRTDPDVIIINKRLADQFWPGQSALGRELRIATADRVQRFRVIGIAPDLVYEELGEETAQSKLMVYVPYARVGWRTMAVLVRAEKTPGALGSAARASVRSVDPAFASYDMMTMGARRRMTTWGERFLARTFAAFAAAAVLLACLGAYGLTAYAALQRTREIGVRLAIGAQRADIVRLLLGRGARLAFAGAVAGVPLAVAAARLLEGLLFRVSAWETGVWVALPVLLIGAVLLASLVPAHRASLTDPAVALRHD